MLSLNPESPDFGAIPDGAWIYSVDRPSSAKTQVPRIIVQLGLIDRLQRRKPEVDGHWTTVRGTESSIAYNQRSGAIRFELQAEPPTNSPFSIDEEQLAALARDFVRKTKLVDLTNEQLPVNQINYLRERMERVGPAEGARPTGNVNAAPDRTLDARVVLGRKIDELPVRGEGGYALVRIAADASVFGGLVVWREPGRKLERTRLLSPATALAKLRDRLRAREIQAPVDLLRADLCYFELGPSATQARFEPAYAFVYETEIAGMPYKSAEVIPASAGGGSR